MKKNLKTIEIVEVYKLLSMASNQGVNGEDRYKLWSIFRQAKPIAVRYEEEKADALKVLSDDGLQEKIVKAKEYEVKKKAEAEELPMTDEEYKAFMEEYVGIINTINKALEELNNKEVELDFEPITDATIDSIMMSNDKWPFGVAEKFECLKEECLAN